MNTVYIIDNDVETAQLLKNKLINFANCLNNIEIFTNSILAYQAIQEKKPDLIFSDIEMPHMNGIELHEKISNLNIPFVYVTASSNYSLNAIKLQAFDYILKPVIDDELEKTIKRFMLLNEPKIQNENHLVPLSFHVLMTKQKKKIMIRTSKNINLIAIESIVKIKAKNNYSCIYLDNTTAIDAPKTLKHFERELASFGFIRVHKSYLANLTYIDSMINKDKGHLVLKSGEKIEITREKELEIKKLFQR